MQLVMNSESSVEINSEMAAVSTELLNGKLKCEITANGLTEEITQKLVSKENLENGNTENDDVNDISEVGSLVSTELVKSDLKELEKTNDILEHELVEPEDNSANGNDTNANPVQDAENCVSGPTKNHADVVKCQKIDDSLNKSDEDLNECEKSFNKNLETNEVEPVENKEEKTDIEEENSKGIILVTPVTQDKLPEQLNTSKNEEDVVTKNQNSENLHSEKNNKELEDKLVKQEHEIANNDTDNAFNNKEKETQNVNSDKIEVIKNCDKMIDSKEQEADENSPCKKIENNITDNDISNKIVTSLEDHTEKHNVSDTEMAESMSKQTVDVVPEENICKETAKDTHTNNETNGKITENNVETDKMDVDKNLTSEEPLRETDSHNSFETNKDKGENIEEENKLLNDIIESNNDSKENKKNEVDELITSEEPLMDSFETNLDVKMSIEPSTPRNLEEENRLLNDNIETENDIIANEKKDVDEILTSEGPLDKTDSRNCFESNKDGCHESSTLENHEEENRLLNDGVEFKNDSTEKNEVVGILTSEQTFNYTNSPNSYETNRDVEMSIESSTLGNLEEENGLLNDTIELKSVSTENEKNEVDESKNSNIANQFNEIIETSQTSKLKDSDVTVVKKPSIVDNVETTGSSTQSEISKEFVENNESNKMSLDVEKLQNENNATCGKNEETVTEINDSDEETPTLKDTNKMLKEALTRSPTRIKLSNNLDILSDDDDDEPRKEDPTPLPAPSEEKCINLDEDDDCMLIDEDSSEERTKELEADEKKGVEPPQEIVTDTVKPDEKPTEDESTVTDEPIKDSIPDMEEKTPVITEKQPEVENKQIDKPLIPKEFLKNCKRKLCDMSRDDLEEFCVLKIAEAVIDRTNLNDIKSKLKTMFQNIEEYKNKTKMLTKQNRDLQVVLKSVQEEQKKKLNGPITPLKITRSVGMQVVMVDKQVRRKPLPGTNQQPVQNQPVSSPSKIIRPNNTNNQRQPTGTATNTQQIPVPRLVPAQNSAKVANTQINQKPINNVPNGARKSPSIPQKAEKRPISRQSTPQSVTVDLTDDEPPAKTNRTTPVPQVPPVRLVNQQSLMAPRIPNPQATNSPRKVYIPISSTHSEGLRVGQKIMLRGVRPPEPVAVAPQIRGPPTPKVVRLPGGVRLPRMNMPSRHPAPLPEPVKQYQPPNWKALPPAPDLKLSKVENGIVISWKIDGYLEDKFEEIASYQLYAYQETTAPASTNLWKKIGDVKALPLPMACTLTQFMAGYKYYFAVRAVDVRSRVGPFSLPGSILLLNKV